MILETNNSFSMLLMLAISALLLYFLIIRPARRRAKDQAALMDSLTPGTRVLLAGGLFGTISHLGDTQAIVEVAPGVELTVTKQAILRPADPADDEFEFTDEEAEVVPETVSDEDMEEFFAKNEATDADQQAVPEDAPPSDPATETDSQR
ncbi:MAG: preprotein translocase subunit YajC [Propionibacteriales bacterium]|nr:MAG: preprotein translocase subunit YajC [Propionibacteriales bacterium]